MNAQPCRSTERALLCEIDEKIDRMIALWKVVIDDPLDLTFPLDPIVEELSLIHRGEDDEAELQKYCRNLSSVVRRLELIIAAVGLDAPAAPRPARATAFERN